MPKGSLSIQAAIMATRGETSHIATEELSDGSVADVLHEQVIGLSELRLQLQYRILEHVGLEALLPIRWVSTSIVYRDSVSGKLVTLAEPEVHHREESLTGLGDAWLLGGWRIGGERIHAGIRAGLTLPTGKTEENPFLLGEMGQPHQHIQFGTGTFNPLCALEGRVPFSSFAVGGFLLTQQSLYENGKGYQAGDKYAAGLFADSAMGTRGARFRLGAELHGETAERWAGVVHTDEGNQGRIDVLAVGEATWAFSGGTTLSLALRAPLYTDVVGGQLEVPLVLELGVSRLFHQGEHHRKQEHEHEREHEHEHHHDHEPVADVADASTDGEAISLAPVVGKVTLFDFWAPWCEPCHDLEQKLLVLAGRHQIAIRRVNIVSWDSPAAQRYLQPSFNLPHLKA